MLIFTLLQTQAMHFINLQTLIFGMYSRTLLKPFFTAAISARRVAWQTIHQDLLGNFARGINLVGKFALSNIMQPFFSSRTPSNVSTEKVNLVFLDEMRLYKVLKPEKIHAKKSPCGNFPAI